MRPESSADRLIRVLLVLACVALSFAIAAFVVHLIRSFSTIVVIVVGSVFLIYLIAPAIAWLQRFMKKHWAVALALVGLVAIFVLFALIIVPPLVNQAAQFAAALPGAAARATIALRDPNGGLARLLPSSIRNELAHLPERMFSIMARYAVTLGKQGFTAVVSGVGLLLLFIIIPVLAAYALFDYPELQRGLLGFVPKDRRPQAIAIMHDVNEVIGAFVRGQLLDCLIVGAMIGVWLMITGVPFALVIAVAAGVLNLIPYVGAIAGFIPSVLLALAYNGWQNALIVAVGFAIIQQIDGDFIVPRIMKSNVKLSPVIIILSIVTFGSLFGIIGAFVAVPTAAILRVFKLHFAPSPSPAEIETDRQAGLRLMKFQEAGDSSRVERRR
ncbi:MAG: AI-2E family transporter [Candidatus Cybelea sp.]|jgi:predicted PurR-regulated permease PerM